MSSDYQPFPVIEHETSQQGRWLRGHRVRIAIWIAVVEGILVVVHVIPWWAAVIVAALAVFFYFEVGRKSGSDTVRQSSWIVAASQAIVALVPILVVVVGTLALVAVGVLAVLALIALFAERR
jgi:FtsH-binding integral membrane protein